MTDRLRSDRQAQQCEGQTTLWPIYAFHTSDGTARRYTYDEPRLKPHQRGAQPHPVPDEYPPGDPLDWNDHSS